MTAASEREETLTRWNLLNGLIADNIFRNDSGVLTFEQDKEGQETYLVSARDTHGNILDIPEIETMARELHEKIARMCRSGYRLVFNQPWTRAQLWSPEGEVVANTSLQIWAFSEIVNYFCEKIDQPALV